MANTITDTADKTLDRAIDKANGTAREFKSKFQDVEHKLEKMSNQALDTSRDYVQENPGKSIAIAAAAGLVAGSLLTMALRRR